MDGKKQRYERCENIVEPLYYPNNKSQSSILSTINAGLDISQFESADELVLGFSGKLVNDITAYVETDLDINGERIYD